MRSNLANCEFRTLHFLKAEEIYQRTMELRLLPLASITDDFERTLRDLARSLGKELDFVCELKVDGLPPTASGRPYQLWLTSDGRLAELCGAFQTAPDGSAAVPMNAPYTFKDFGGWVVVEEGTQAPLLTT